MSFSNALFQAENTTRIVLFAPPIFADCLLHCLEFHNIENSFYCSEKENLVLTDYHIFQTENAEEFKQIKPNITLVLSQENNTFDSEILQNIINGGVLIYNEKEVSIKEYLKQNSSFYRQLSFENSTIEKIENELFINTDFSQIPILFKNEFLQENCTGLQILAQQLGIMEEDFYEALMGFEA